MILALGASSLACGQSGPSGKPAEAAPSPAKPKTLAPAATGEAAALPPGHPGVHPAEGGAAPNPHAAMTGSEREGMGRVKEPPPASAPTEISFDGKTRRELIDGLGYTVPEQWATQPPSNRMRLAQYDIPGPGGGASFTVYRFPGGAGTVDQNVERWLGQFDPPEGKTLEEVSKVEKKEIDGLAVTQVEVSGNFGGQSMAPMAAPEAPKSDMRMFAAIVEGQGDPYFVKVIGPNATLARWQPPLESLVASLAKGK